MRYIQSFSTSGDVQTAIDNGSLGKPYVAYIQDGQYIDWNSKTIDYTNMPLTFKITSDGILKIYNSSSYSNAKYSINGADEVVLNCNETVELNVVNGDKVVYKISNWGNYYQAFKNSTAGFKVYGNPKFGINNIDSLDFREVFYGCTGLTDASNLILSETTLLNNCYQSMFQNCTSLTTAPELPATTLANNCYNRMFYNCTSLTTAPALPATTLAEGCYLNMFYNCTSLTTAPELPATTLASHCYRNMFYNCTSLTTAPELPATTLASRCYYYMFYNCTSLNYIKCLATDITASNCTTNWVSGVSQTGTFVKNANMSDWTTGTNGIPNGWTVIDA